MVRVGAIFSLPWTELGYFQSGLQQPYPVCALYNHRIVVINTGQSHMCSWHADGRLYMP